MSSSRAKPRTSVAASRGYQTENIDNEQRQVKLSWKATVSRPGGRRDRGSREGRIESKLSQEDKDWLPKFLLSFCVPSFALPGKYRVSVEAKDEIGGNDDACRSPFRVRGHELERSETLVARNFRFLRSENDAIGTRSGLYHPGDTLWARFDVTGYKFGENNHFSVDCGMAVEMPMVNSSSRSPKPPHNPAIRFTPNPTCPSS